MTRLTDEQRALAAEAWELAQPVARHWMKRYGARCDWDGEIGLRICNKIANFDPSKSSLRMWAQRHAQYAAIDAVRQATMSRLVDAPVFVSLDAPTRGCLTVFGREKPLLDFIGYRDPVTPLERVEVALSAMKGLTWPERLTLWLHWIEEWPMPEIAELLGCTECNGYRIARIAIKHLRYAHTIKETT